MEIVSVNLQKIYLFYKHEYDLMLLYRINAVISHNIIRHKVSDAANDVEEPLKESKEKVDIETLIKQNEDLREENKNLTVRF